MSRIVLTIKKDQIICNNQYRINLKKTNIPRSYGTFNGGFFWASEIVRYDKSRKTLLLKIVDYDALKEDFLNAGEVPYHFENLHFQEIDLPSLQSCLDYQVMDIPVAAPTYQGDLFQTHPSEPKRPTRIDQGGIKRIDQDGEIVWKVTASDLIVREGFMGVEIDVKGHKLFVKVASYDGNLDTFPRPDLIRHRTGKTTMDVVMNISGLSVKAYSSDLAKVLRRERAGTQLDSVESRAGERPKPRPSLPEPESLTLTWQKETFQVKANLLQLGYGDGEVSFQVGCPYTGKKLEIFIPNPVVKPEFVHIARYFCNALGKKEVPVDVELYKHQDQFGKVHETKIASASSPDLGMIDSNMVVNVSGDYCLDRLFQRGKDAPDFDSTSEILDPIFDSPDQVDPPKLIERLVERKPSIKHANQLRFLAGRHLVDKMPVKLGGDPRSFLFLLKGGQSLYLVLETLDTKLATYVWECADLEEEINKWSQEVDDLVTAFESANRQKYKKDAPENFVAINHDYLNLEDGYFDWQGRLLEVIEGV